MADFSQDPRAVVIHPGVNVNSFSGKRRAHQGIVIGTACRLEPVKGLSYLLEAMALLVPAFPGIRLEIAGDGSLRQSLEQETRRLRVCGSVSFIGWREDIPSVMESWDIFAMPSLDEGFPVAGLEAMAAGLPVVTSEVGGLPELLVGGETGWLVPAAAPAALFERLSELIGDGEKREAMGEAGRRRVHKEFSIGRMVEQTVAVYDRLLSE